MFDISMTAHETAATGTHPYRVITEPVPYWDDLLLTVYAVTITGERVRIGVIRSDDGKRWRWLDKAQRTARRHRIPLGHPRSRYHGRRLLRGMERGTRPPGHPDRLATAPAIDVPRSRNRWRGTFTSAIAM